jgi:hypothetical protein
MQWSAVARPFLSPLPRQHCGRDIANGIQHGAGWPVSLVAGDAGLAEDVGGKLDRSERRPNY